MWMTYVFKLDCIQWIRSPACSVNIAALWMVTVRKIQWIHIESICKSDFENVADP